jgi:hypothetical protein
MSKFHLHVAGLALASMALGAAVPACAATELKVGRSVLVLADEAGLDEAELPTTSVSGDGNLRLYRTLARLATGPEGASSFLLIENVTSGGGRFEWNESCKGIKPTPRLFVYSPFNTARDQCVMASGPYLLDGLFGPDEAAALQAARAREWPLKGGAYYVRVSFALSSGAMMVVQALVPTSTAGMPVADSLARQASELPPGVIGWAMALGEQVQKSVLSLSGNWQLPPIKQQ